MGWYYRFYAHTDAGERASLATLSRYGNYVQLSNLALICILLVVRAAFWLWDLLLSRKHPPASYEAVAAFKLDGEEEKNVLIGTRPHARKVRQLNWWLNRKLRLAGLDLGTRTQFIIGSTCAAWLLCLSFLETGDNYNQLCKRFAMVAVALFPIQVSLSMRFVNPFAYLLRSSHVDLTLWHRLLGNAIQILLTCHTALYINKYIQLGGLSDAFHSPVVITGGIAFMSLSFLSLTSLAIVRQTSYRVFFIVHILVASTLHVVIFFHVKPARIYVVQALGISLLDRALRRWQTANVRALLEVVPDTDLIKITATISSRLVEKLQRRPGSHVYVSIPPRSRPVPENQFAKANLVFNFISGPLTVGSVNVRNLELILVARRRNGPMTRQLDSLACRSSSGGGEEDSAMSAALLRIEGPYGGPGTYSSILSRGGFDSVLIFVGGIGMTFGLPIYQYTLQQSTKAHVNMVWSVRHLKNTAWAPPSVLRDQRMHIFVTGKYPMMHGEEQARPDLSTCCVTGETLLGIRHSHQRPNLEKIIGDALEAIDEGRLAVLVCGPLELKQELQEHVCSQVRRGRDVWWHDETFSR
ncbi:hypothetical protein LX36DRAFT_723024 [Colletotrichum falcatum]|nr:hypothetical protein LX36DRAFT_723024 [Colletotrichum falcatum]